MSVFLFRKRLASHICVLGRNVGDNALNLAIRQMLERSFPMQQVELLRNSFDRHQVRVLERSKLLVFGGGGLIHSYGPHGNAWERTGTMWNIRLEDLRKLRPPIVCYSVGFNHFYGDPDPLPQMRDFFRILCDKGALIGFRNDGSVQRFLGFFPEFEGQVEEIPDAGVFFRPEPRVEAEPYAVLQIAADRPHLRYGERFDALIAALNEMIGLGGVRAYLVPHTIDDEALYKEIAPRLNSRVSVCPLKNGVDETAEVVSFYAGAIWTLSTRGHSQILSIGNRTPTFSISTHPKVLGFAESCSMERWCLDFRESTHEQLIERFTGFLRELESIKAQLVSLNQKFDRQIEEFNRRLVAKALRGAGR